MKKFTVLALLIVVVFAKSSFAAQSEQEGPTVRFKNEDNLERLQSAMTALKNSSAAARFQAEDERRRVISPEQKNQLSNLLTSIASHEGKIGSKEARMELHAKFKDVINTMKDNHRKQVAERIDLRLNTINASQSARMSDALTRLTTYLEKAATRTQTAKDAGKNVDSILSLIDAAKTAITNAQAAVTAQSAKTYTPQASDEAGLKQASKISLESLKTDLKTTQDAVNAARQAVLKVIQQLYTLMPLPSHTPNESTPTPTLVPSVTP